MRWAPVEVPQDGTDFLRSLLIIVAWIAVLLPGHVGAEAPAQRSMIAVFPVVKTGAANDRLVDRVQSQLEAQAKRRLGARVIVGAALRAALEDNPKQALVRCGDQLKCIAKLGARAGAHEVLIGRVSTKGRRIRMMLLVIDVAAATVIRHAELELKPAKGIAPAARAQLNAFLGGGGDTDSTLADSTAADVGPGPERAAREASGEATPEAPDPVAAAVRNEAEPDELGAADERDREAWTAAPLDYDLVLPSDKSTRWGPRPVLLYAGIAATGAGVVALGAARLFATRADSVRAGIKRDGSISQPEGAALYREASTQTDRANLSLMVGGALVLSGVVLMVIDRLFSEKTEVGSQAP
ncbi:MAG: hypothetical protein V3T05_07660 [Myxococcota bacterium]